MKDYLEKDPWHIIEQSFHPAHNKITESILSIGNGYMGQRANFEEKYSGQSMSGSYLAGIYYPDTTRVGWWKNGYPEFFAKVLNNVNWIGINIYLGDQLVDLHKVEILEFTRSLNMQTGILSKHLKFQDHNQHIIEIISERFCSLKRKEIGAIYYTLSSINFNGTVRLETYLDFDVVNEDANYNDQFWSRGQEEQKDDFLSVHAITKKTNFEVWAAMFAKVDSVCSSAILIKERFVSNTFKVELKAGDTINLEKIACIASNFYFPKDQISSKAYEILEGAKALGYQALKEEQIFAWKDKWIQSDIKIEGDVTAQQAIRFNIFQLNQTYTGEDVRLNIGPKGFTGEKYGGSTYWDTEAYCLPFYMSTSNTTVAKNLLIYRYKHLPQAIENAGKLGLNSGAALYPMVTMDGAECHNEWEITFEEIHRNGAIAYAIHDYIRYTGSKSHLAEYGLEVLIGIARFWKQRVNFSEPKNKYVILGVTGPNEYENNVNNNWYTNYIASWCLKFAVKSIAEVASNFPRQFDEIKSKTSLKNLESEEWLEIADNMFFPYDEERQIFLQQDGFLDKELMPASSIPKSESPIHEHWSWDRILRSCFIKQADVLQGLYFFEENFNLETLERNFDFYEPMTVHESSLSPCIHTILACRLGRIEKAYELYLRTARLDLDDYNNDTDDGLHITSMAGTWMSIVKGFGGMRVKNDRLHFNPVVPEKWQAYSFLIRFRSRVIRVKVAKEAIEFENLSDQELIISVYNEDVHLAAKSSNSVVRTVNNIL